MIIYNVTVKIDHGVHEEWFNWMKEFHIPDVMNTGFFLNNRMCKILTQEEDDGVGYAIQYTAANMKDLEEYMEKHALALQKEHIEKFQNKFVAFRTLLEVV